MMGASTTSLNNLFQCPTTITLPTCSSFPLCLTKGGISLPLFPKSKGSCHGQKLLHVDTTAQHPEHQGFVHSPSVWWCFECIKSKHTEPPHVQALGKASEQNVCGTKELTIIFTTSATSVLTWLEVTFIPEQNGANSG